MAPTATPLEEVAFAVTVTVTADSDAVMAPTATPVWEVAVTAGRL